MSLKQISDELYTGKRSIDFIGKRKIWFSISIVLIIVSLVSLGIRGLNLGIEFTGGSQITISNVKNTDQSLAQNVIKDYPGGDAVRVLQVGDTSIQIQSPQDDLTSKQIAEISEKLAQAYSVSVDDISSTAIGSSWGSDMSRKALVGFLVFVALAVIGLAIYFHSVGNSVGAILALFNDLVITVGVYGLLGFEVSPSSVIGLLTVLAYSLYDTVVVFDKVRENTTKLLEQKKTTFAEYVNLAVNQTLIRSLNTSVTSLLPVASILFIGVYFFGATTLRDLALVMFVGLILSTLSSVFIASPLAVVIAQRNEDIKKHTDMVLKLRSEESVQTSEKKSKKTKKRASTQK